jgi:hypothetical protein
MIALSFHPASSVRRSEQKIFTERDWCWKGEELGKDRRPEKFLTYLKVGEAEGPELLVRGSVVMMRFECPPRISRCACG